MYGKVGLRCYTSAISSGRFPVLGIPYCSCRWHLLWSTEKLERSRESSDEEAIKITQEVLSPLASQETQKHMQ